MVDYTRLAATAKRLVEKNGRTLSLYKRSRTASAPLQPWRGTVEQDPAGAGISVIGVVVPAAGSGFGRARTVDGTLAESFDEVAIVAAASLPDGVELEGFSNLVDDSRSWKIDGVEKLKPGDTSLLYVLRLSS